MLRRLAVALLLTVLCSPAAFAQNDKQGSKDYPGIARMPDHYIYNYETSQYDAYTFPVTRNGKRTEERIEGKHLKIQYLTKKDVAKPSALQIARNYQNAVKAAGGQVVEEQPGDYWFNTTLLLKKDGNEVWIRVKADGPGDYWIFIVEREAMKQDVTMDAAAMSTELGAKGSVALYGIYFDTGKAVLKPESEPALAEVAKLLAGSPTLKVFVVGHTDMVGDAVTNLKLSQARAEAVVAALTGKHGVAAARLIAFGNGPYAPVASNKTDDGRAKNRRVELVEIATK
jgi:OOP family OmpA-OmpF porin